MAVCFALIAAWGASSLVDRWKARQNRIFSEEVLDPLRRPHENEDGFWVGDITELYRIGRISRKLAEADTAPLNPLVPKPVPIHGYYVRVMNSGPSDFDGLPAISFKGTTRCPDHFAVIIYPAVPGPGKLTWIFSKPGQLRRQDGWTPTFDFPTDQELKNWGRCSGG